MNSRGQKKICFVAASAFGLENIGGAELQIELLANEFSTKYGYRTYVTCWARNERKMNLHEKKSYEIRTFRGIKRLKDLWALPVYKLLKDIRPDVCYQRGASSLTIGTALFSHRYRRKFVWAVARLDDCDPGAWIHIRARGAKGRIVGLAKKLLLTVERWLIDLSIAKADLIVCQTAEQENILRREVECTRDKRVVVIPNGHPRPNYSSSGRKDDPPVVLWVGSLKPIKRPDIFVNLAEELVDCRCRFVMVGRVGDRDLYRRVLLPKIDMLPNFTFIGELSHDGVLEKMRRASILVNTSISEGLPNTFIEAWLHRTPVVSLYVDPDHIIERYGLGRYSKNFAQLVEDVKYLVNSSEEIANLGDSAYKYASENYDISKSVRALNAKLLELY